MKFFKVLKDAFTKNIPYKILAFALAVIVVLVANIIWIMGS